jgi:carbon storage regulator
MLVLSRKKNEQIVIGGHITITVVEVRGDKVRLGIEAPRLVSVHRKEVQDAIERDGGERSDFEKDMIATPRPGIPQEEWE